MKGKGTAGEGKAAAAAAGEAGGDWEGLVVAEGGMIIVSAD